MLKDSCPRGRGFESSLWITAGNKNGQCSKVNQYIIIMRYKHGKKEGIVAGKSICT